MQTPWSGVAKLSEQELLQMQNVKLQHFLTKHVYPFSPHYRRVFDEHNIDPSKIRTVADLKHIPLTSKKDFTAADNPAKYKDFILQPDLQKIKDNWPLGDLLRLKAQSLLKGKEYVKANMVEQYRPMFMTFTTGTTSTPIPFVYSKHDLKNLELYGARMLKLFGIKEDERIINLFPFAPHLAFWQVFFGAYASNVFSLSTGGGKCLGTEGNIRAIMNMKPAVILGVPGYIYHVLRCAQEQGADLSSVRMIVCGAAKVTMAYKKRLAGMLKEMGASQVSIMGTYGFTEARCAWAEYPTEVDVSSGYYLYPDQEIFEVIDPDTGEVKGPGEDGELVYTSLNSRASVVIRYRTGDFVHGGIVHGTCPYTGMNVPRISSNIGRISDIKDLNLSKVKGALVNLMHFHEVLSEFPEIDEWQLELGKRNDDPFDVDQMILYLAVKPTCNTVELEASIRTSMLIKTEVSPNEVRFIPFKEMVQRLELETANKEKRIIDKRPKD